MDEPVKEISITQGEISALKKLIMYVKFSCDDTESLLYAGSDSINSFLDKILDVDYLGDYAREFYSKRNPDNEKAVMDKIERSESESISKMDEETMHELFKACIYPFSTK
ncbi:hypothetical protein [Serratia sp. AKBS12]|uniref:hypothetical protein n=1 Tax=Serratia sp. AKBS12 TaxID=2974597 RepID=UPI002166B659|nr:hypothetical protein [Serratia sp. AKBS12]MCS3405913.1 hypothetical protein [Serratia sp. AKBS12]